MTEQCSKDKYALVKSQALDPLYEVVNIEERSFTMFDDMHEAIQIIDRLLKDGAEIFENMQAFWIKYPPLSTDERKRRAIEFMANAKNHKD